METFGTLLLHPNFSDVVSLYTTEIIMTASTLTPAQKLRDFYYRVSIPVAFALDERHSQAGMRKTGDKHRDADHAKSLIPKNYNGIQLIQLFHDGCMTFHFMDAKKVPQIYEILVDWLNSVRHLNNSPFHRMTIQVDVIEAVDLFAAYVFQVVRRVSPAYSLQANVKPVMEDLYRTRRVQNPRYRQSRIDARKRDEEGFIVQPEHVSVMDDILNVLGSR
jgi:hypothetical protein